MLHSWQLCGHAKAFLIQLNQNKKKMFFYFMTPLKSEVHQHMSKADTQNRTLRRGICRDILRVPQRAEMWDRVQPHTLLLLLLKSGC